MNPGAPFSFQPRQGRLPWRDLWTLDTDRIFLHHDIDLLQQLLPGLLAGNIDAEPQIDDATKRLVSVLQFACEYLLYVQDHLQTLASTAQTEEKMVLEGVIACPYCTKFFANSEFLDSHVDRRHAPFKAHYDRFKKTYIPKVAELPPPPSLPPVPIEPHPRMDMQPVLDALLRIQTTLVDVQSRKQEPVVVEKIIEKQIPVIPSPPVPSSVSAAEKDGPSKEAQVMVAQMDAIRSLLVNMQESQKTDSKRKEERIGELEDELSSASREAKDSDRVVKDSVMTQVKDMLEKQERAFNQRELELRARIDELQQQQKEREEEEDRKLRMLMLARKEESLAAAVPVSPPPAARKSSSIEEGEEEKVLESKPRYKSPVHSSPLGSYYRHSYSELSRQMDEIERELALSNANAGARHGRRVPRDEMRRTERFIEDKLHPTSDQPGSSSSSSATTTNNNAAATNVAGSSSVALKKKPQNHRYDDSRAAADAVQPTPTTSNSSSGSSGAATSTKTESARQQELEKEKEKESEGERERERQREKEREQREQMRERERQEKLREKDRQAAIAKEAQDRLIAQQQREEQRAKEKEREKEKEKEERERAMLLREDASVSDSIEMIPTIESTELPPSISLLQQSDPHVTAMSSNHNHNNNHLGSELRDSMAASSVGASSAGGMTVSTVSSSAPSWLLSTDKAPKDSFDLSDDDDVMEIQLP
jgi:hypothetical protein